MQTSYAVAKKLASIPRCLVIKGLRRNSILDMNKLQLKPFLFLSLVLMLLTAGNFVNAATRTTKTAAPWGQTGTWVEGIVPVAGDDVFVYHKITVEGNSACKNLTLAASDSRVTVQPGIELTISGSLDFAGQTGVLELFSNQTVSGSVIFGTMTSAGNIAYERYLTGTTGGVKQWHLLSVPADFASATTFFGVANINQIEVSTNGKYYSFGGYSESTNTWIYPLLITNKGFGSTIIGTEFSSGTGYCVAKKTSGSVKMSGLVVMDNTTVDIAHTTTGTEPLGGFGWNALGNPFTAAINVARFLSTNSSQLDPIYGGLYIWDPVTSAYVVSTHAHIILNTATSPSTYSPANGAADIQTGQGFVVRSKTGGGTVTFLYSMREHKSSLAFKSGDLAWPAIELKVATSSLERTTMVAFNSAMTLGLDPYYDAGLLKSGGGLELYTKLVEDNGVNFALQCLPDVGLDKIAIPVSLDLTTGAEVTFTAKSANLPAGVQPVLEDRLTGTRTLLTTDGASYKVTLASNTTGINRFYLTLNGITSAVVDQNLSGLKVYPINKAIYIQGTIAAQSVATLYDMNGRSSGVYQLNSSDTNIINADGLANGIYVLRIMEGSKLKFTGKISLR